MDINPDFRDLVSCLNAETARFLVVGGYAVMFHTEPRCTKDLDVWIDPTPENAAKVFRALSKFGAPIARLTVKDLVKTGNFVVIGTAPNRIDIITSIEALDFAAAWKNRVHATFGGEPADFLSAADLVKNKRAVGREQDRLDVETLERWSRAPTKKRRRR